jgi:hypothetical protein
MISGHIYLIKLCAPSGKCIYKIGKSENFMNRLNDYLYFDILNIIKSDDISKDENNIINIFSKKCILDKGREFFTGPDENNAICLFMDYFNEKHKANKIINEEKEIIIKEIKEKNKMKKTSSIIVENLICPKCNQEYKYPCLLKRHLKNSARCKDDNIIVEAIKKNNEENNCNDCNICNKSFSRKSNLIRHLKETKCSNIKKINDTIIHKGIQSISIKNLKTLLEKI